MRAYELGGNGIAPETMPLECYVPMTNPPQCAGADEVGLYRFSEHPAYESSELSVYDRDEANIVAVSEDEIQAIIARGLSSQAADGASDATSNPIFGIGGDDGFDDQMRRAASAASAE